MSLFPSHALFPSPGLLPGTGATAPGSAGAFVAEPVGHEWLAFSRDPDNALDRALPIASLMVLPRHMGVGKAVLTTPYTPERYLSLMPPAGLVCIRDGVVEFEGPVMEPELDWDSESGKAVIKVSAISDETIFADRISFPDPSRAPDDQTVNDYWTTRDALGNTVARSGAEAMMQLMMDQAGPQAHPAFRHPDLRPGAELGIGARRVYSALWHNVMHALEVFSVASGENLGIRVKREKGLLYASVVEPDDVAGSVKFSANLNNLTGVSYKLAAPTATDVVVAGKGELKARLRRHVSSTHPDTAQWQRQIWSYVDRRDSEDPNELLQAGQDAVGEGGPTVSLALTLADSEAGTYRQDWALGSRVTVHVGLPGQPKAATVTDVVREILFEVDSAGVEKLRPAIGTYDAKAVTPTPTQQQLAAVVTGLAGLRAR